MWHLRQTQRASSHWHVLSMGAGRRQHQSAARPVEVAHCQSQARRNATAAQRRCFCRRRCARRPPWSCRAAAPASDPSALHGSMLHFMSTWLETGGRSCSLHTEPCLKHSSTRASCIQKLGAMAIIVCYRVDAAIPNCAFTETIRLETPVSLRRTLACAHRRSEGGVGTKTTHLGAPDCRCWRLPLLRYLHISASSLPHRWAV